MMDYMDTAFFELKQTQCESREEYEQLVRKYQNLYVGWQEHLRPLIREKRLNYRIIAEGCEVSEASAGSFIKKIPAKRENVILLAMLMKLTVEETDELLTRWAKYQKLYARNPSDAIWIFLLQKGGSDHPRALFRKYYAAYEQLLTEYKQKKKKGAELPAPMDTLMFFDKILENSSNGEENPVDQVDPAFVELMQMGMPSFERGYQKLLDYINSFFYDLEKEDRKRR